MGIPGREKQMKRYRNRGTERERGQNRNRDKK